MKKCKWRRLAGQNDDKLRFYPCNDFEPVVNVDFFGHDTEKVICKSCNTDIRKPKPEPLIVKSGETWVVHSKGVNYLCLSPEGFDIKTYNKTDEIIEVLKWEGFKPFSEITLTDEIAKLRPMVEVKEDHFYSYKARLWGKDKTEMLIVSYSIKGILKYVDPIYCRLITPHELQAIK